MTSPVNEVWNWSVDQEVDSSKENYSETQDFRNLYVEALPQFVCGFSNQVLSFLEAHCEIGAWYEVADKVW